MVVMVTNLSDVISKSLLQFTALLFVFVIVVALETKLTDVTMWRKLNSVTFLDAVNNIIICYCGGLGILTKWRNC